MALPDTLPTNPHIAGDTGHVTDHNLMVTSLTDLQTAAVAQGPWSPLPVDHNMKLWSGDPLLATGTFTITQGVVYLSKIKVPFSQSGLVSLWLTMTTALTTPTAGQNVVGIYDSNGNLLCTSADVGTTLSSIGAKQLTIPSTNVTGGGFVYGALLTNCTTAGGARCYSAGTAAANNIGLTVATSRGLSSGSAQTALPATITLSSATQTNNVPWMGLS